MTELQGKVAIVTGGASGIGRAGVALFVQRGCRVVIADLDPIGGKAAVQAERDAGGTALFVPTDVGDQESVAAMVADNLLTVPVPIASGPRWGVPSGSGLGVEVDEDKVARYHEEYRARGQFLPYDLDNMAAEDPEWRGHAGT